MATLVARRNALSLGFAALFLNHTNRSGILNAGMIEGFSQKAKWLIDARFNRAELADRIRRVGHYDFNSWSVVAPNLEFLVD
jgi:DNA adenine methylase